MKNKLIIGMLLSIVMITLVSASMSSLGTFKQGQCIELKQTCASCSYVNFTRVSYPDSTRALTNVQADKEGSLFNLEFCNTGQLGRYIVEGIGDVDGTDTVFAYDFEITPTGALERSPAFVIILLSGILLFGFLGFMFRQDMFLHILFLFMSMLIMLYGIRELHMPVLFFSTLIVVIIAFVYYVIQYIRDMIDSMHVDRGWEGRR